MKLGIWTPVVQLNPRFDPPKWELDGGIDEVVAVARAAEAAGLDWVSCSEHVFVPTRAAAVAGRRYWDPLATLSYLAAATRSIGLFTNVLVLGDHHPLEIVKGYGTLDVMSGGRLILGVGVGAIKKELSVLGAPLDDLGARTDDAMRALRALWGKSEPTYDGPYFQVADVVVEPCGRDRRVPLWVGGRSRRSLRRALELGDGWAPFGLELPALRALLGDETLPARPSGFEVVLSPEPPLDPVADPDGCTATMRAYAEAGATACNLRFVHRSLEHYLEQLAAVGELAASFP